MAIIPLQLARVSNLLRTNIAQSQIAKTQQSLLIAQNELSTGRRLNSPSDDPGDSAIVQQLRKTLEQRQSYSDNLKSANSQLSEVDSTLGDLSDLLNQAQTIASANVGSDVTPDQRVAAATIVQSIYSQILSLGDKQFDGSYIFAGDRSTAAPFIEESGGVRWVGSTTVLQNQYDENTVLPFQVNGADVFGALSTRVKGSVDLSPALALARRLITLKGATNDGVRLGSIDISNGTMVSSIDLSDAQDIGDVINKINAAAPPGVVAALSGQSFELVASGGANITVKETAGGTTAADLGLLTLTGPGADVTIVGRNVHPQLRPSTDFGSMANGAGINLAGGLTITNGLKTANIDLTGAVFMQDLLDRINSAGVGVQAAINDTGTGLNILNTIQGSEMTISENGGTVATQLGIRSFNPNSQLSELNQGVGMRTVPGNDIIVTRKDGTTFSVELDNLATVQNVIDAINTADAGGGVTAGFATTGNGITLTDSTGGAGALSVAGVNFSTAAKDLGIEQTTAGATITGTDVDPVAATGIFSNIGKLRDALQSNDQTAITAAAVGLKDDYDRVVRVRGETGARVQELESRQNRLEDENIATKTLLSSLEDTDFNDAVTRFQTLQTSLQASMQTSAKLLNLSLLDFLG